MNKIEDRIFLQHKPYDGDYIMDEMRRIVFLNLKLHHDELEDLAYPDGRKINYWEKV